MAIAGLVKLLRCLITPNIYVLTQILRQFYPPHFAPPEITPTFALPITNRVSGSAAATAPQKIETMRNFTPAVLVLPPVLLRKSPRNLTFGRCCESRKKGLTFAPRFDRRREGLEKRIEEKIKTFTFRLPVQNFCLPLHSQSQERALKARKTGR